MSTSNICEAKINNIPCDRLNLLVATIEIFCIKYDSRSVVHISWLCFQTFFVAQSTSTQIHAEWTAQLVQAYLANVSEIHAKIPGESLTANTGKKKLEQVSQVGRGLALFYSIEKNSSMELAVI